MTEETPHVTEETPDERTPDEPPVHPKHRARDRFGKEALQTAHEITQALAETGADDDGVVVLRTGGPRPALADLERLIDEALEEEARAEAGESGESEGGKRGGTAEEPGSG